MNRLFVLCLFMVCLVAFSEAQVTIRLNSLPAKYTPQLDTLFVAGDFNDWNPRDTAYRFKKNIQGQWEVTVNSVQTTLLYKIARGAWTAVEVAANGADIPNRSTPNSNSTVVIDVANWADTKGTHTGTAQVSILTSQLWLTSLKRYRRIWVCVPAEYDANPTKHYPVAYFHDGQNLFDAATSFSGEWKVDEALAQLALSPTWEPLIAVGIDNGGGERINELTPFRHQTYGGGQGEMYGQDVTECVKPLIDNIYRTKTDAANTAIGGSSLGGIETLYMGFARPDVFSKMLAFSPSLWFSDSLQDFLLAQPTLTTSRLYLLCGTNEGDADMVPDMNACYNALLADGFPAANITKYVIAGGTHSEGFWSQHAKNGLQWLFGTTTAVKKNESPHQIPFHIQKSENQVQVSGVDLSEIQQIRLVDMMGRKLEGKFESGSGWRSQPLAKGVYTVSILYRNELFSQKLVF